MITSRHFAELIINTILFFFLFGYVRSILIAKPIDSYDIIVSTILFFFWYFMTIQISEFLVQ